MYKGDLMAIEDLTNNSICIKDSGGIRNIRNESDSDSINLVFVSNVSPIWRSLKTIKKGEFVRYKEMYPIENDADNLEGKIKEYKSKVSVNKNAFENYETFKEKYKDIMNKSYGDLIQTSEVDLAKMYVAIVTVLVDYHEDHVLKLFKAILDIK